MNISDRWFTVPSGALPRDCGGGWLKGTQTFTPLNIYYTSEFLTNKENKYIIYWFTELL